MMPPIAVKVFPTSPVVPLDDSKSAVVSIAIKPPPVEAAAVVEKSVAIEIPPTPAAACPISDPIPTPCESGDPDVRRLLGTDVPLDVAKTVGREVCHAWDVDVGVATVWTDHTVSRPIKFDNIAVTEGKLLIKVVTFTALFDYQQYIVHHLVLLMAMLALWLGDFPFICLTHSIAHSLFYQGFTAARKQPPSLSKAALIGVSFLIAAFLTTHASVETFQKAWVIPFVVVWTAVFAIMSLAPATVRFASIAGSFIRDMEGLVRENIREHWFKMSTALALVTMPLATVALASAPVVDGLLTQYYPVLTETKYGPFTMGVVTVGLLASNVLYTAARAYDDWRNLCVKTVTYCPHAITCMCLDYERNVDEATAASVVMMKFTRIPSLPLPDKYTLAVAEGSALFTLALLKSRNFTFQGPAPVLLNPFMLLGTE